MAFPGVWSGTVSKKNNTFEDLARLFTAAKDRGFGVTVVKDATPAPRHPEIGDGYKAAVIDYGFLANAVLTSGDAVKSMS